MFSHDDNDFNNLQALVEAVKQWYIHAPGHDVGTDLNKVAVAYVRYEARAGFASEQPTGRTDLPPIVPEMIPSQNAQVEVPEPDMEAVDAMERAGRQALVEETRKAWVGREVTTGAEFTIAQATVDLQTGKAVATSGWVQTVKAMSKEMLDESGMAFNNRYHKVAAEVSRAAWDKAYCHLAMTRASCSAKEIESLAKLYAAEDPELDSAYDGKNWQ